jgi:hypothetical protein
MLGYYLHRAQGLAHAAFVGTQSASSLQRRDFNRAIWVTSVRMRREDRPPSLLIPGTRFDLSQSADHRHQVYLQAAY